MVLEILLSSSLSVQQKILQIIFCVLAVVLAISIHESFHGIAALAMGDDTAKRQGRISLNPFRHMDPLGTLMLCFVGFGWASPVQINPNNFKHRKAGTVITAIAGPLSNLIFAFIGTFAYQMLWIFSVKQNSEVLASIAAFFMIFLSMNIGLAVFNLIPLPPLDGSKILAACLPFNAKYKYLSIERYSFIIFIALLVVLRYIDFLSPISNGIFRLFWNITAPITALFI